MIDLNVTVPMRLTRAVLPAMISGGGGTLAYVSSEAGLRASISGAAYTTAKHVLNGFVKSVAFDYGPLGVRANAVAPGGVHTGMNNRIPVRIRPRMYRRRSCHGDPDRGARGGDARLAVAVERRLGECQRRDLADGRWLEHCLNNGSSPRLAQPRPAARGPSPPTAAAAAGSKRFTCWLGYGIHVLRASRFTLVRSPTKEFRCPPAF